MKPSIQKVGGIWIATAVNYGGGIIRPEFPAWNEAVRAVMGRAYFVKVFGRIA